MAAVIDGEPAGVHTNAVVVERLEGFELACPTYS
jgi:hypothetical protein